MSYLFRKLIVTLLVTSVVFTIGCNQTNQQYDEEADKAAIAELREQEMAAFSAGDVNTLEKLFTADIKLMPPNDHPVTGTEKLRSWAENMFSMINVQGEYTSSDLTLAGDVAIERLTMSLTMTPVDGGEPITETGKCIHVYKRQADGSWKIAQDIWNMDNPPAATPEITE